VKTGSATIQIPKSTSSVMWYGLGLPILSITASPKLDDRAAQHLFGAHKAIKAYRQLHGVGLKKANDYIDKSERK
jgi:hypothetical protein